MEFYLHNYAIEDSCLLCSIYTKTDSLKNKSKFNNIIQIKWDWNEYITRDGNEYTTRDGNEYTTRDGNEYITRDGNEYTTRDGNEYTSRDGNGLGLI